jgi:hypothetical protein
MRLTVLLASLAAALSSQAANLGNTPRSIEKQIPSVMDSPMPPPEPMPWPGGDAR